MRRPDRLTCTTRLASLALAGILATLCPAAPTVELELITEPDFPLGGQQRWLEALSKVGVDGIRIREGKSGDEGGITNDGTEAAPRYRVFGVLTSRNQLRFPGVTFSIGDIGGMKDWFAKLKADGTEGLFAAKGAFGLTGKQLLEVHEALSPGVGFSTKGEPAADVVARIVRSIELDVKTHPSAKTGLESGDKVASELNGLSRGTALAAVLRPLGLVLVPVRPSGGTTTLWITDARTAKEIWPVGWPPEKSPAETFPKLFDFRPVDIQDFPLSDALAAIEQALESPILYDHNSLARHGVDPAKVIVNIPKMRTYYQKIVDRLLAQAKPQLTSEIRVDEAGQPFLWITTLKP